MKLGTERDAIFCHPGMILSTCSRSLGGENFPAVCLSPAQPFPGGEKCVVWLGTPIQRRNSAQGQWRAGQQNLILQRAPCHSRKHSVYQKEPFSLKVICAFQKTAALTLINNQPAQPKACWANRTIFATGLNSRHVSCKPHPLETASKVKNAASAF